MPKVIEGKTYYLPWEAALKLGISYSRLYSFVGGVGRGAEDKYKVRFEGWWEKGKRMYFSEESIRLLGEEFKAV